jgi:hypothetical protein
MVVRIGAMGCPLLGYECCPKVGGNSLVCYAMFGTPAGRMSMKLFNEQLEASGSELASSATATQRHPVRFMSDVGSMNMHLGVACLLEL